MALNPIDSSKGPIISAEIFGGCGDCEVYLDELEFFWQGLA